MGFTRAVCLAAAAGATLAYPAAGAEVSPLANGNGLYNVCKSEAAFNIVQCISFLEGFARGVSAMAEEAKIRPYFCVPSTVTNGQLHDIVVSGLQRMAKVRHLDTRALLMVILQDAFPCPPQ